MDDPADAHGGAESLTSGEARPVAHAVPSAMTHAAAASRGIRLAMEPVVRNERR
jgi:hypothetical protein